MILNIEGHSNKEIKEYSATAKRKNKITDSVEHMKQSSKSHNLENPQNIFINGISTVENPSKSQYIELSRLNTDNDICLNGYSVLITSTKIGKPYLYVRACFSLHNREMKNGQKNGIIGRNPTETSENNDIMTWKPKHLSLSCPGTVNTKVFCLLEN